MKLSKFTDEQQSKLEIMVKDKAQELIPNIILSRIMGGYIYSIEGDVVIISLADTETVTLKGFRKNHVAQYVNNVEEDQAVAYIQYIEENSLNEAIIQIGKIEGWIPLRPDYDYTRFRKWEE